jgi:anti-sigma regulatory factor (Ser/Thr protein kinase)
MVRGVAPVPGVSVCEETGTTLGMSALDMASVREVKATFPLTVVAARSARRWLDDTRIVPFDARDIVRVLLSELVSNSVVHSGLATPDTVRVLVSLLPGSLRVEVSDDGIGLGHDLGHDMGRDPARAEQAFGLRIVERAADRWGHTDHPTKVWFEVALPAA